MYIVFLNSICRFLSPKSCHPLWVFFFSNTKKSMNFIFKFIKLSGIGLPIVFNLKGAICCAIGMYLLKIIPTLHIDFSLVAVIIGHLHFFLEKELSQNNSTLKTAVRIYLESTSNHNVDLQTVENLFKASSVDNTLLTVFKHSHVDKNLLLKGAIQTALDNLLRMSSRA